MGRPKRYALAIELTAYCNQRCGYCYNDWRADPASVPSLSSAELLAAVERAWFEQAPLRVRYRSARGEVTERTVRIRAVLMDRGETRLRCDDLDKGAPRELVLHRVERATVARHEPC